MRRCDVALAAMPTQFVVSRMEQTRVFGRVIRDPAPNCVSKKKSVGIDFAIDCRFQCQEFFKSCSELRLRCGFVLKQQRSCPILKTSISLFDIQ